MSTIATTVLTLTGPTASGKDTFLNFMVENYKVAKVLSDVTRPQRKGETDGVDYNFITRDKFEDGLGKNEYLNVVEFQGNFYGAKKKSIEKTLSSGNVPLFILEPKGLNCLPDLKREFNLDPFSIFITAPLENLLARYFNRTGEEGLSEKPAYHLKRIQGLLEENQTWHSLHEYDYVFSNDGKYGQNWLAYFASDIAYHLAATRDLHIYKE